LLHYHCYASKNMDIKELNSFTMPSSTSKLYVPTLIPFKHTSSMSCCRNIKHVLKLNQSTSAP